MAWAPSLPTGGAAGCGSRAQPRSSAATGTCSIALMLPRREFGEAADGLSPEAFDEMLKARRSRPPRPPVPARFVPNAADDPKWQALRKYRACLHQLQSGLLAGLERGELIAFGEVGNPVGPPQCIPLHSWKYLKIDEDQKDLVRGENVAFFNVQVIELSRINQAEATAPVPIAAIEDARMAPNSRGPSSIKYATAINEMMKAIESGQLTRDALVRIKKKNLPDWFPVARETTLLRARRAALAKLRPNSDKRPIAPKINPAKLREYSKLRRCHHEYFRTTG